MRLLILILILMGAFFILRLQYRQSPRLMYQWLGVMVGVGLVLMVLTGRAHWIAGVIGATLPFLGKLMVALPKIGFAALRWFPFIQMARRAFGGNAIRLKTAWLEVKIDRRRGDMDGTVLQGEFKDRSLSSLSKEEWLRLQQACQSDAQSVALLKAYIARCRPQWQTGESTHTAEDDGFDSSSMSRQTAAQILGISMTANQDEIQKAYRGLAQKLHPDRGGNDYLTRKINQARDVLLRAHGH